MSVANHVAVAKSLGFTGKDVRHIGVYIQPKIKEENGALVQTHCAYVGEGSGDYNADFPTDFIFISTDENWVFEPFDLAGKTWDGLAMLPEDGDFTISFGDANRRSVIVEDRCQCFFTYRYQIVLRHVQTGELVVVDPGMSNADRPPTGG